MKTAIVLCLLSFSAFAQPLETTSYRERWRPQFHFTPAVNWMNDPNGMLFFDGEYHLFYQYNPFGDRWGHMSWGHAVSRDMLRWEHLPVALFEEDGIMMFSGSAVVDWKNTSGFGKNGRPPLVAIYTGHYTQKPLQNQQIAYSNDRGRTWTKFSGNPVLDLGEKDFRDPKVFWHEPAGRWVMAVSWPVHRKVRFYASPNLKDWSHLSDFGPAGSTSGIWECPDLFPIVVEGAGNAKLWALIVNVGSGAPAGGSGCQYFVGTFDGTRFTLDPSYPKPRPEFVPEGRLIASFERDDYDGWRAVGSAFGNSPARGKFGGQQDVGGFRGSGFVNTFLGGDTSEGTLTSPEFEITHNHLSFLIGGGQHPGQTCLNLLSEGRVARTATGDNTERLAWKSWDVRDLRGKKAVLEIVDRHQGGWGHINVDHILLADDPARPASEPALWADWSRDFYAAVSWSDIPQRDGRRLWIGWMSNWEYANTVPTSPWRSAMSIPRELTFRRTPDGVRLIQRPVKELQTLAAKSSRLRNASLAEANAWLPSQLAGNLVDLEAELDRLPTTGSFGLAIRTGGMEETRVVFDPGQGTIRLDRTRSGRADFHPRFQGVYGAPLRAQEGKLTVRILIDTSSVELFAQDGETVLSTLMFPNESSLNLTWFSEGAALFPRIRSLALRPLKRVWK